jgi:hypothetical protein
MDPGLIFIIIFLISCVLFVFSGYLYAIINDTLEFIERNNFPELDLPNGFECSLKFFRTMWNLRDMEIWIENYEQHRSVYAKEKYGSTNYFDKKFYFRPRRWSFDDPYDKKRVISKISRIAKIAIPMEPIIKEVDGYYAANKKDYDDIGSVIEIIQKIQNEMIENSELNSILRMDNDKLRNILKKENDFIIIYDYSVFEHWNLLKICWNFANFEYQDINDKDKNAIRDYFMKVQEKNTKYIFLSKIIKKIQDDMLKKNILDPELKMEDKQILHTFGNICFHFLYCRATQKVKNMHQMLLRVMFAMPCIANITVEQYNLASYIK